MGSNVSFYNLFVVFVSFVLFVVGKLKLTPMRGGGNDDQRRLGNAEMGRWGEREMGRLFKTF